MTRISDTSFPSRPRAKRVQFGRGGPEVSQVCFGTEHIVTCTPSFGGSLLADAADLYDVFFIDTDMVYGSHPQVAQAIRTAGRSRFVVSTKTYAKTEQQARKDLDRIFYELGTDYIDIALLHRVRPGAMDEHRPPLEVLLQAKERGLIRHVGLSTHSPEIAAAASSMPEIEILYVTLNREGSRLDSGSREEMQQALAEAHRNGKGTCVLKTLGRGDLVHD
jgi:aryl-alcohol dehydrogenase-like predicted oxidoreductase